MTNEQSVFAFRVINKFAIINEHIHCKTILDALILAVNLSEGSSKVGALFALRQHLKEKTDLVVVDSIFEKLQELNRIPKYDLSTYEGFLEAFVAEMSSGASFGGAMSGAGSNSTINSTGMAGVDKPLKTKRKIDKILQRTL